MGQIAAMYSKRGLGWRWLGAAIGCLSLSVAALADETARTTESFVDSIGVCTHWSYGDTPYGFEYAKVKKALVDSGIRHIRDGFHGHIDELARLGIQSTVVAEPDAGSPTQLRDKIKAVNQKVQAVDAVEGPNEPDLFWVKNKKTYQGKGFPEGVLLFQKDLYTTLKSDPATKNVTVIGPALGKTYDPGGGSPSPFTSGLLTDSVDWGNFHPYPGGNPFSVPFSYGTLSKYYWSGTFPSANLDEFPYALNTYRPAFAPKPMCATETGYSTYYDGQSEFVHAKYMPRLFAEYFRLGISAPIRMSSSTSSPIRHVPTAKRISVCCAATSRPSPLTPQFAISSNCWANPRSNPDSNPANWTSAST